MRILFISHFFPPELGAPQARIYGLAKHLQLAGHEVTVITGLPNYPDGIIHEGYRRKTLYQHEEYDGLDVYRVYVYAAQGTNTPRRLANYFSFTLTSTILSLHLRDSFDLVISSSPPIFVGLTSYLYSRLRGVKHVFDVRDLVPQYFVDVGAITEESLLFRMLERLELLLYSSADAVTVVTNAKRRKVVEKGTKPDKVHVVPNAVDWELISQTEGKEIGLRREYNLTGKYIVIYAGLIGVFQGIDVLVEAAKLVETHEDIQFVIIGEGIEKPKVAQLVATLGLRNTLLLPKQPKEIAFQWLREADVSVVPLKTAALNDSVPSKLLESMAHGCPVILAARGEAELIVSEAEAGLVVEPGDHKQMAEAIVDLYRNQKLRERCARNGREHARTHFSRKAAAVKLAEVFEHTIKPGSTADPQNCAV